jgi:hypothetical protein
MTKEQYRTLFKISVIILETIEETKDSALGGVPESYPYIALGNTLNLSQYQTIIRTLQKAKAINVDYNLMTKGEEFNTVLNNFRGLLSGVLA